MEFYHKQYKGNCRSIEHKYRQKRDTDRSTEEKNSQNIPQGRNKILLMKERKK